MLRFSANISMMFTEVKPLERFAAAAESGFAAVEWQLPYTQPLDDVARAKERAGVEMALINLPMGDTGKGDRGLGALPHRVDEFRAAVDLARRYAERLNVKRLNLLAGAVPPGIDRARARDTLVDNMRYAARKLGEIGATVCTEMINTHDMPEFFLSRPDAAVEILDACGENNVALQYDFYHMQRMGVPLIPEFEKYAGRIGHIQFADVPGRHEPGSGTIDFPAVFAAIGRSAYDGWTGAEYNPSGSTADSLGWFAPYRRQNQG